MKCILKSGTASEDAIQATYFQWVRLQQRFYPELQLLFHIPNGGSRHILEAYKMKKMGVLAGIPDVFLAYANCINDWNGFFIEFKSEKGKLSKEQIIIHDKLRQAGYKVVVCRSCIDAILETKKYLGIE